MQQPASPPVPAARRPPRRFLLVPAVAVVAFLAGFVPQWIQARSLRATLAESALQLELATLHRRLGMASHEAQRNNYASAADEAREFFDECAALASRETFPDEPRTRVALLGYTAQRDEIMGLLSAADPAARDRLAGLYLAMNGVLERRP